VLFSGDDVLKSVDVLSGGECSRLHLAKMMLLKHNILVFDEPTNHLDMEAIDELTKALQNYQGTLLIVSHNAYFVSSIANRVLEITLEGVKNFMGSYDEYVAARELYYLKKPASLKDRYQSSEEVPTKPQTSSLSYDERKQLRNRRSQLKQAVEKLEKKCQELEVAIAAIDKSFAAETFYVETPMEKQQELMLKKLDLEKHLEEALTQWEEQGLALQELQDPEE
jgi:ABC-type multidrug transport system ATPase subunit